MIPLVCIDVDGTLVGPSRKVTNGVWNAVDQALERGQRLALTTARGAFGASWEMASRLDPNGWHVFHAGGAVVNTGDLQSRAHSIDTEIVDTAIEIAMANDWVLELYSPNAYAVDSDGELAVDHADLMEVPFEGIPLDDFRQVHEEIVRAQFVVGVEQIPAVTDALTPTGLSVTSATSPIMPGVAFISATRTGITKATGIEMICQELGITKESVMMIGDGLNDLPAIRAVGHPVAMGNAEDEVKAQARYVVADVVDDGVVEALELSATLEPTS